MSGCWQPLHSVHSALLPYPPPPQYNYLLHHQLESRQFSVDILLINWVMVWRWWRCVHWTILCTWRWNFSFSPRNSISNLSFLFCAQNVAKIEGLSVEYWTSLWAGLSQIYLHFKLKMASLWQVVMFEPVPSQECSLSMLWLVPTHISGGAFINWYQSEHLCTNMCVPALILWSKTLHLMCGQSQRANILTQMLHWIFFLHDESDLLKYFVQKSCLEWRMKWTKV